MTTIQRADINSMHNFKEGYADPLQINANAHAGKRIQNH